MENNKKKNHKYDLAEVEFKYTDGNDLDFSMLCNKLDNALDDLVGGKFKRTQYEPYNQREDIHDVILAYRKGKAIACGGFKMFDKEHAELKRIFTDASNRNMGIGTEIVKRLEELAKIKGFKWCILETGNLLEVACYIYQKAGYKIIPNYGPYTDMKDSICMERLL